jgi:hypothetical protein
MFHHTFVRIKLGHQKMRQKCSKTLPGFPRKFVNNDSSFYTFVEEINFLAFHLTDLVLRGRSSLVA